MLVAAWCGCVLLYGSDLLSRCAPVVAAEQSIKIAEYLRQHIRDSKLEMLLIEGHFSHLIAPEIVAGALRRHLA